MTDLIYDLTIAQALGRRDCQEDAVAGSFALGSDLGFVVLADGMGGHAAGDIASRIVVTEVFSELMFQAAGIAARGADIPSVLRTAAEGADSCLAAHVRANPPTSGMGSTLVAPVILRNALWWISIGDSPLFLFRDGELRQLNEDHSLAPQIDFMMANGLMDQMLGKTHPDRNVLTSALFGERAAHIDCPAEPVPLCAGDIVIAASDGLQFLDNAAIAAVLTRHSASHGAEIGQALLQSINDLGHQDQDNVSFALIRVQGGGAKREMTPAQQITPSEIHLVARSA